MIDITINGRRDKILEDLRARHAPLSGTPADVLGRLIDEVAQLGPDAEVNLSLYLSLNVWNPRNIPAQPREVGI